MASNILGKSVIVGITFLDAQDELVEQIQIFGTITEFELNKGIIITKSDNSGEYSIPPQPSNLIKAKKGIYRLRSTGEEIVNPDYYSNWTLCAGPDQTTDEINESIEKYRTVGMGPFYV